MRVDLETWLNSPETKLLVAYLHRRRAEPLNNFLAGTEVSPVTQGKAAAWHELEKLLTSPPEHAQQIFEIFTREHT